MLQRNKARAMRCAIAPYELQKNSERKAIAHAFKQRGGIPAVY